MSDALAQINLYDPGLRRESDIWTLRNMVLVMLASLLVMGSWAIWAHLRKERLVAVERQATEDLQAAKVDLKTLSDQLVAHKPDTVLEGQLQAAKARLAAHGQILSVLKAGLSPDVVRPSDVLRGFANRVPQGLWLTGFRLDKQSGFLEISGRTTVPTLIPAYATQLGKEKAFAGRTFAALEITDGKQQPSFHEFKLSSSAPDGGMPELVPGVPPGTIQGVVR